MISLLTHLKGVPLSAPGDSPILSIVPSSVSSPAYGIRLTPSVVLLSLLASTYGIPQTSSSASPSMPISNHGIPSSRVQPSSMVSPHMGSFPSKLSISAVASGTVFSSDNQKRFERSFA